MKHLSWAFVWALVCTTLFSQQQFDTVWWGPDVSEGFYNDPASWREGVVPSGLEFGGIPDTVTGDVTVKIPKGGLIDSTGFIALGRRQAEYTTITIDTSGTRWVKKRDAQWPADWVGFMFSTGQYRTHLLNVESLNKDGKPILELNDAVVRYRTCATNAEVIFESGLVNTFDPDNVPQSSALFLAGSSPGPGMTYRAIVKPGATIRANHLCLRGNMEDSRLLVEGGEHYIRSAFTIKDAGSNSSHYSKTSTVAMAGGMIVCDGRINMGQSNNGTSMGVLDLYGDAQFIEKNSSYLGLSPRETSVGNCGKIMVRGHAKFQSSDGLLLGYGNSATGMIEVTGHGLFSTDGHLALGEDADGSRGEAEVGGNGRLHLTGNLLFGTGGGTSSGSFRMKDQAMVTIGGKIEIQNTAAEAPLSEIELLGGELSAGQMNGNGGGSLFVDGCLVKPIDPPQTPFLSGFALAKIGSFGFQLNTGNDPCVVNQQFTDDSGAFVKTGCGTLTVRDNSSHAETQVREGALLLADGVTRFGRKLVVSGQSSLSLEGPANHLQVQRLVLGEDASQAFLKLDAGDLIEVMEPNGLEVSRAYVTVSGMQEEGSHSFLKTRGEIAPEVLRRFFIVNPQNGKGYTFTSEENAAGEFVISVVVTEGSTSSVWTGAAGSRWNTAANWESGSIPNTYDAIVFPEEAQNKTVLTDQDTIASKLSFTGDSPYLLGGDSMLSLLTGMETRGNVQLQCPVSFIGSLFEAQIGSVTTSAVSGSVTSPLADFVKSGDGAFCFNAPQNTFAGRWTVGSGLLSFEGEGGLGSDFDTIDSILLKGGTFRYDSVPVALRRGVTVNSTNPVVMDIRQDLTLRGGFTCASDSSYSAFVKIGPGKLTMDLPEGNWSLAKNFPSGEGANPSADREPSGVPQCAPNGNWSRWDGLGSYNVLDGTLHLKGQGKDKTMVSAETWNAMGSGWKGETDPVLIVDNLKMITGKSGKHFLLGNGFDSACPSNPALRVINDAVFDAETFRMGANILNGQRKFCPTLVISNAMVRVYWATEIPDFACKPNEVSAVVRATGPSAVLQSYGPGTTGHGIYFGRTCDVLFEDHARMEQLGTKGFVYYQKTAKGKVAFTSGATMQMMALYGQNYSTSDSVVDLYFDDATMKLTRNDTSLAAHANDQGIRIGPNGMFVSIPRNISHALRIPLRGEGNLTKVGEGELVLGKAWELYEVNTGTKFVTMTNRNCEAVTGSYAGKTVVNEGTLTLEPGAIREGMAYHVAPNASLNFGGADSAAASCILSGRGSVSHGHLTGKISIPANTDGSDTLLFQNCALEHVVVDFNRLPAEPYSSRTRIPVAILDPATVFAPQDWEGVNMGQNIYAEFSRETDGTVYAQFCSGGLVLLLK